MNIYKFKVTFSNGVSINYSCSAVSASEALSIAKSANLGYADISLINE